MIVTLLAFVLAQDPTYEDHLGLGTDWLRVTGAAGVEVWHDDNVLLSRDELQDDIVTVIVPELRARAGGEDAWAQAGYRGRDRHYLEHSEFNGMEHFVDGDASVRWGPLYAEAWDRFQYRHEAFNVPVGTERLDWLQNDAGALLGLATGRLLVEAAGETRLLEIDDDRFDFFDHHRNQASFLAGYEIRSRVHVIAEAGVASTEYDDQGVVDNFDYRWLAGGVRGHLRDNMQLLFKAGQFRTEIEQESGAAVTEDDDQLYVAAAFEWQPSDAAEIRVSAERRPLESILSGWAMLLRFEAGWTQQLSTHLEARLGGYWEEIDEVGDAEDRDAWGGGARLQYAFSRHFAIAAYWEMRARDSDDSTFEYENRRGYVSATVSW